MAQDKWNKSQRMLTILNILTSGKKVSKIELANRFNVDERSIQRDISDLNRYLAESEDVIQREITYNAQQKVYEINGGAEDPLTDGELFALVKILLESRALVKEEMDGIIKKLTQYSQEQNQQEISDFILNEQYHYQPLQHKRPLVDMLLNFMAYIKQQKKIKISYIRQDQKVVERTIIPLNIMFSEYYFYLATYTREDSTMPIMYRLDRILNYEALEETFRINYATRFEEGEFRKRIQFMYPGNLMRIKLKFWGASLEALLDRLPTARVIEQDETSTTVQVEVYGPGIKMWILSQADRIEVLEPTSLREEMKNTILNMAKIYGD